MMSRKRIDWRALWILTLGLTATASLRADTVAVQGSWSVTQARDASCDECSAGVDVEDLTVNADGSWSYDPSWPASQTFDEGIWFTTFSGAPIDSPTLPPGSTINYAELTFNVPAFESVSEPWSVLGFYFPPPPPEGSVPIDLSYWINSVSIYDDQGGLLTGPSSSPTVSFVPTSPSFSVDAELSGGLTVGMDLNAMTPPTTPGDYYLDYYANGPIIDYTLTVDYNAAVPEPRELWLVGAFSIFTCIAAARRKMVCCMRGR
jgi:hypothetical protein